MRKRERVVGAILAVTYGGFATVALYDLVGTFPDASVSMMAAPVLVSIMTLTVAAYILFG